MDQEPFLSDSIVNLDRLPKLGRHLKIRADAEQLQRIATVADVSSVGRLSAELDVVRIKGGIQVLGKLSAEITQPCVVTLDPVHQQIDEKLDRVFLPAPLDTKADASRDAEKENAPGSEAYIDLSAEDAPDYYDGPMFDVTDYLLETFALAIDLYPRTPGAKMSVEQAGDDPAELSPFAMLKSLKTD